MKIIQTSKAYYPLLGGIETIVQQLAEGFALRQNLESRVVVCNDNRDTQHKKYNGVSVTYAGTLARISSLPISPTYPFHLLRETGDILHMHEPFLVAPLVYLMFVKQAKKRFKRVVLWWHSDVIRQRKLAPLYTPLLHAILHEVDAIIVATPNHITSSSFLPNFVHKCNVIHFGIEPLRFTYTQDLRQRTSEIQLQYNRPIILFVGRLIYYKGVEYLVQAMQAIPEAHLVVVGDGPLKLELQQLSMNNHNNNVTFLSPLEEKELVAMYQACDIFVLPSVENSEAFGIVQLEAMACGKPVITSDLPTGVTYVNRDGVTGLVVPKRNAHALASAIKTLLANPDLRQRLGEQARIRVEREFTVAGMVEQTLDLYQNLLK